MRQAWPKCPCSWDQHLYCDCLTEKLPDIHQARADREGITREQAKLLNYVDMYSNDTLSDEELEKLRQGIG